MKTTIKSAIMVVLSAITVLLVVHFAPVIEYETPVEITTTTTTKQAHANGCDNYTDVKDLVAYINIPNTDIEDAVVQASDNDYYLRRNKYGSYSFAGCYFAAYECDMANLSQNTIVYGHNLRDESRLFGQLNRFKDLEFYKTTPLITFDIKSEALRWKVFGVFIVNTLEEDGEVFYYLNPNFNSQAEFMDFTTEIKHRSLINTTVDIQENDKILLLSTCDYTVDNNWRLVIASRLVRDEESEEVDVENATVNENPLYPDGWYRRFGGVKPTFAETTQPATVKQN